jgi:hypothetical protein
MGYENIRNNYRAVAFQRKYRPIPTAPDAIATVMKLTTFVTAPGTRFTLYGTRHRLLWGPDRDSVKALTPSLHGFLDHMSE